MKRCCLLLFALLLTSSLLSACHHDVQVEESGQDAFQSYQLPTEYTVTKNGGSRTFTVSYDGSTAAVTEDGKLVLRFTLDENGNAVQRENADGSRLEAVYGADGKLAETLLREKNGVLRQRTVYDENGRAVQIYTRESNDNVTLKEYRYGEDGERLSETQYYACQRETYEYHENGQVAAENVYLMESSLYDRREYDENGNLTWMYEYDGTGNVAWRFEFDAEGGLVAKYDGAGNRYVMYEERIDKNGNLIEYRSYSNSGDLLWREVYDYGENGNQVARRHYEENGRLSLEDLMTYDEAGVLTVTETRKYHVESGELWGVIETQWDEAGNAVQEINYEADGSILYRSVQEYECIGGVWVVTLFRSYDGEGALLQKHEKTYDGSGNRVSEFAYDGDGALLFHEERTYDERGNLIETAYRDEEGVLTDHEQWSYDQENNLREQIRYNPDGSVFTRWAYDYTYAYDDGGRLASAVSAAPYDRLTYAYESGSGLRKVTVCDENGEVVSTEETVSDSNGNPRLRQRTELGDETRLEYEWTPEGGLRSCVQYGTGKEELSRLEASGYVPCTLTEAQYRQIIELLLESGLFAAREKDVWVVE